jgi:hypothetical protein
MSITGLIPDECIEDLQKRPIYFRKGEIFLSRSQTIPE